MFNENTTHKEYHIICKKCKKYFFKIYDKIIINYFISIENFFKNFNEKNWIEIFNISVLSIHFMNHNHSIMINKEEYDLCINHAKSIMIDKNHDYQDAWRNLDISSIEDIILQKIFRINNMKISFKKKNKEYQDIFKKILDNYIDILNYSIFILIKKNK